MIDYSSFIHLHHRYKLVTNSYYWSRPPKGRAVNQIIPIGYYRKSIVPLAMFRKNRENVFFMH